MAKKAGYFFEINPYRFKKKGGNQVKNPIWQAGNAAAVIAPDNQLLLPCYHRHAFGFPIDNNNLYELWNSAEVRRRARCRGGSRPAKVAQSIVICSLLSYAISLFFWKSPPSTLNYLWDKWISPKATFKPE